MLALSIAVLTVILVSAFCSLLEAVLYAVPLSTVESMARTGSRTGLMLQRLRKNVDRPITAILSLNTIANTAGAAVAGALAVQAFGEDWLVYFSAAFTMAILLFSEIIPKTTGVTFSRSLAGPIVWPLQLLVWVFSPLIWICRQATEFISRGKEVHQVTEDDLKILAHLSHETGVIEKEEAGVIQNILALQSKSARDIMTPRSVLFSLSADLTVNDVHEKYNLLNYSRMPVIGQDNDDIVGIVHRRMILTAIADNRGDVKIESLMRPVHFVIWNTSANRLLRQFLKLKQHMFAVIDEFGGLSGIVTLEDVLEEILGLEIVDEFDQVSDMQELARRRRKQILEQYKTNDNPDK